MLLKKLVTKILHPCNLIFVWSNIFFLLHSEVTKINTKTKIVPDFDLGCSDDLRSLIIEVDGEKSI